MARIVDKDTRLIDVDFGPLATVLSRAQGDGSPNTATSSLNGELQLLYYAPAGAPLAGSFIQYQQIDLSFMTMNNEVMQPTEISVQRTSPVPLGYNYNGNDFDQIEEYIYIFSRPLNNSDWLGTGAPPTFEDLRELGLDRSQTIAQIGGVDAGIPDHQQTIYAEKRMYSYSSNLGATVANGGLVAPPANVAYLSIYGMPILDSVTTWGTMSPITGPQLHCYRVVINRTQETLFAEVAATDYDGVSSLRFPPVNITMLCRDPKLTDGEYLTRLANAMNSIPEDGPTA